VKQTNGDDNVTVTGEAVVATRVKMGLSRDKFAKLVGLTPGAVWRIENKNSFKTGELEKLHAVLEVPLDDITVLIQPSTESPTEPAPITQQTITVPTPQIQPHNDLTHFVFVNETHVLPHHATVDQPNLIAEPDVPGLGELSPYQMFLQDGIRRYSNSEIQTFKRCSLKWYMAYYLRLAPITESPIGVRAIGDRLHRALRWHYHPDSTQRRDVRDALEIIIKIDHAQLVTSYAPELIPLAIETEFAKEADLERVMMQGYVEWLEETGADSELIITGSEEYLEADLPVTVNGQTIRIVGRLDARALRTYDNVRLFLDHKSVGNLTEPARLLALNEQMKMYILLEMLVAGNDQRVDGAIFNMIRRCKRTATAKPPFYARVEVRHNNISLQNFQRQLIGTIQQIENARLALDAGETDSFRHLTPPAVAQDCTWSCDYLPLHSVMDDGSHWKAMANALYRVVDPSHYYVKKNVIGTV
jgi:transcriptional regulator with XRE-family HTH domain